MFLPAALLLSFISEQVLLEQFRLHPNEFQPNHLLGEFYIQQRSLAKALPFLERAYALNPSDYLNAFDLCTLYLQLKAPAKAAPIVEELLRHEEKAELRNLLGDIEEAQGQVDAAAAEYEKAARLDPSEKNLFDLGSDLLKHGGFEPAVKVFTYATGRYRGSVRLLVGLGVAHYSLGQYDDAVAALCSAVDLDPADTKAFDFLGKMYDVSPQHADDVTARLARFVQAYPSSAPANFYYALSLRKRSMNGSIQQAEPYLRRAIKQDPTLTQAHYELGLLLEDRGAIQAAIEQFQIAIHQRPSLEKAHYRLARLYAKTGKRAEASKEFAIVETLKKETPQ